MTFRKGRLRHNISLVYKGENLEIAEIYTYLAAVFTISGSFNTVLLLKPYLVRL
jgi:hypothetical protein